MNILFIIGGLIVIALLLLAKQFIDNDKGGKASYTYKRKKYLMTRAEHEFYDVPQDAVRDDYRIFAQVHLSTILDHKVKGQNWSGALSHIQRKSVDFVLCNRDYLSPQLVIELDDKSHNRKDRVERDKEVGRILEEAGVPLLRIENKGGYDVANLSESISAAISGEETMSTKDN